jgi:hypothetical protein
MIDRLALAALARAVDADGDLDTAGEALDRADPLLRGAARRRLREAHADALLATSAPRADEGRHALRLAYLSLARALPPAEERDDVPAVDAAFTAARALRPAGGRFWWATTLVAAVLAAGAAAGYVAVRSDGPLAPLPAPAEAPGPPARGAFATGGVPAPLPGDAVLQRVFAHALPDYLITLDRLGEARRGGAAPADLAALEKALGDAREQALGAEAGGALGEAPARALAGLLAAAKEAAEAPAGDRGDRTTDALAEATGALDDALAAAGAGYFVDGDVIREGDRRLVMAYSFAVERVNLFTAGAETVRALHLRRVDRLNWSHTLLGFSRPHLRAALVLLDQLEDQVLTLIAPGLAPGASVRLFDAEATGIPERAAVEARAGALARAEYGALPGLDAAAARLGETLGRRGALLETLARRAEARGLALVVPGTLRLPEGFARGLSGLATQRELAELTTLDEALAGPESQRLVLALRDALAASVERHEVQHRLDAHRPRVMPKTLGERIGPLTENGRERRPAVAARAELSAYLAELARDARTGRVGLGAVARFLFDRHLHGTPECYAAWEILEGLGAVLGLPAEAPLVAAGAVDRRAAARLYLALAAQPPERLRDAAQRLWAQLFAAPLPDLHAAAPSP